MYNSAMMNDKKPEKMRLLDKLKNINDLIERICNIKLTEEDFKAGHEEILHVYLHEACHATVAHAVPRVLSLAVQEHTAVDEIMARLLEMELAPQLGVFVHTPQEQVLELRNYPVAITPASFKHLLKVWQTYFWPKPDLVGMATYLLAVLRHGRVIYHILPREDWQKAHRDGIYTPHSLETEGFIHCSEINQVIRVANAYFAGASDLCILCIAVKEVLPEIRYEGLTMEDASGFPHIYGPLNLDAVKAVSRFEQDAQGEFVLPVGLDTLEDWEG